MKEQISRIIELEWKMFHSTQNVGGTASCQNNRTQFEIMRKAQFLAWTAPILDSYEQDLIRAAEQQQNLISFKYAYMMKATAPDEYRAIESLLPTVSEEKMQLVEALCRQTVLWAEAFAAKYPNLAKLGRPIHSYEDLPYAVSMETYSRGEWMTYGMETLRLLTAHYAALSAEGRNIQEEILTQELMLSGLGSPAQTEQALAQKITMRGG